MIRSISDIHIRKRPRRRRVTPATVIERRQRMRQQAEDRLLYALILVGGIAIGMYLAAAFIAEILK
jgi:hypothetical protein